MSNVVIRNYVNDYAQLVSEIDILASLSYQYHGDYTPENIFCVFDEEENLLGVGHLEPQVDIDISQEIDASESGTDSKKTYNMKFRIIVSDKCKDLSVKKLLLDALLKRLKEIANEHPDCKVSMETHFFSDDLKEIDFYLANGFGITAVIPAMKFDLSKEIPQAVAKDVEIRPYLMETDEDFERYFNLQAEARLQGAWSINQLKFNQNAPGYKTFGAFYGDELVGNVTVWDFSEENSATENVFVSPRFRNRNIAKALVTTALNYLKDEGKRIASLSTDGQNLSAIHIYKSLSYEMMSVLLEVSIEL